MKQLNSWNILFLRALILLAFWAVAVPIHAQNKQVVSSKISEIEKDISYNEKLLKEAKKGKNKALNRIIIIRNNLEKQQRLLIQIGNEIDLLNKSIAENRTQISETKTFLEQLQHEYAEMLRHMQHNSNTHSRLAFIFSATDFNQAYQRIRYFQQYAEFRKRQVAAIQKTRNQLETQNSELANKMEEKKTRRAEAARVAENLKNDKAKENDLHASLSKQEKSLKKQLTAQQKDAKKLKKQIEKIIAEEIRLAAEKNKKSGKGKFSLTPEEQELSNSFANNKGKLPWPIARGILSSSYGEHAHPILKKITVKNNGVDILTNSGENARAVFAGTVVKIFTAPNYNNVVLIRHGEFITMYAHLDKVVVKKGDNVQTKQPLGTVYTDLTDGKTVIHFELWKGKIIQNPSLWLAKKK